MMSIEPWEEHDGAMGGFSQHGRKVGVQLGVYWAWYKKRPRV